MPSGCVLAELWLVGCRAAASLGIGSVRVVLLTFVLGRSSVACLHACRGSGGRAWVPGVTSLSVVALTTQSAGKARIVVRGCGLWLGLA